MSQQSYFIPPNSKALEFIFQLAKQAQGHKSAQPFQFSYEGSVGSTHYFKHWSGNPALSFTVEREPKFVPAAWL